MRPLTLALLLLATVAGAHPPTEPAPVLMGMMQPPMSPYEPGSYVLRVAFFNSCPPEIIKPLGWAAGYECWEYVILPWKPATEGISDCERADINQDGERDFADWIIFNQHFGKVCSEVDAEENSNE